MRINVYVSSTGFCSRREADRLIADGHVAVNGVKAVIGMDIGIDDAVTVDGKAIGRKKAPIYLAFHKPIGIESTTDLTKKDNIIAYIGHSERIFPVGRLDKDTSGLILLTNDGQIVNRILRVENRHEKEYLVQVDLPIDAAFISQLSAGVVIYNPVRHENVRTHPCRIEAIDPTTFRIVITQGLNLQIRRMCQTQGRHVIALKRVRIMNIFLGQLPVGVWRHLTKPELTDLMATLSQESEG
ncbi:MAG: pseudouridine synthase [bacterium]